ncbi:glycosyltransferase [Phycisphaerales bacterium AB-hyl4]|uniref:Glycosyltransferase n=1 Tax=Natronomicrosphaera hydrolytica TaxID=3242702 RepID=A0ABV4U9T4_9BACT
MSTPRISVIIPCRDEVVGLERTLCSVIDQGYENIELLVADGGSVDGSVELIAEYAEHIAWWHSGPDTGPADGVNLAMRHATGEIVGILHAGDLYLPGALEAVIERMVGESRSDWVVGHGVRTDGQDGEQGRYDAVAPASPVSFLMHDTGQLPTSAVFYRKSLLERHGPFDVRFRFAWSYEMHARLIIANRRPTVVGRLLVAHREDDRDNDSINRTLRQGIEYIEVAERFGEHLPIKQQYALWRNTDERRRIYALAEAEMKSGLARRQLWQRLLRRPWWLASPSYRRMLLHGTDSRDDKGHDHDQTRHAA